MHLPERMRTSLYLLAVCGLLAACSNPKDEAPAVAPPMDTLVSASWLEEHLDDPDLVVLDCTVIVQPDGSGADDGGLFDEDRIEVRQRTGCPRRESVCRVARISSKTARAAGPAGRASFQPMWRSIISAERISEPGLTLSCPAYLGAVPWVASNRAMVSERLAPGAMPIPPTWAARALSSWARAVTSGLRGALGAKTPW